MRICTLHRLSCRLLHHRRTLLLHTCLGGGEIYGVERDFNANNLCWESLRMNVSRGFCQMHFVERTNALMALTGKSAGEVYAQAVADAHQICARVHGSALCQFRNPAWGVPSPSLQYRASLNVAAKRR